MGTKGAERHENKKELDIFGIFFFMVWLVVSSKTELHHFVIVWLMRLLYIKKTVSAVLRMS